MMSMKCLCVEVGCIVMVGTVTAALGQTGGSALLSDVEKAVELRLTEIQAAAQALDPEKVFSSVLENDKGALVEDGKLHRTRDDALQSTQRGFRRLKKIDYQFDQQHITLLSRSVALAVGEGSTSATTVDGKTFHTRFAQTVILTLNDGEWKVIHAHRSFPRQR